MSPNLFFKKSSQAHKVIKRLLATFKLDEDINVTLVGLATGNKRTEETPTPHPEPLQFRVMFSQFCKYVRLPLDHLSRLK